MYKNYAVVRTYNLGLTTKSINAGTLRVSFSYKSESVSILSEGSYKEQYGNWGYDDCVVCSLDDNNEPLKHGIMHCVCTKLNFFKCQHWDSHIRVLESQVIRRISATKWEEGTKDWRKLHDE